MSVNPMPLLVKCLAFPTNSPSVANTDSLFIDLSDWHGNDPEPTLHFVSDKCIAQQNE